MRYIAAESELSIGYKLIIRHKSSIEYCNIDPFILYMQDVETRYHSMDKTKEPNECYYDNVDTIMFQ
jgi:hypothetical protein